MIFTPEELEYLKSQRLGRLATVQPNGSIQNNPVVYWYSAATDTIDIGGRALATTQKFKKVAANGK
jgi:pyridoxamine 5'-phosphate oxidase family protein